MVLAAETEEALQGAAQAISGGRGCMLLPLEDEFLAGNGAAKPGLGEFTRLYPFAALPSVKRSRWLLPLVDTGCAVSGLHIYSPYTLVGRLGKLLLLGLLKTGMPFWMRNRALVASRDVLLLETLVGEVTGERNPVFALSLGTPGRHRKLTVQVMRSGGGILGYIKLPLTAAAVERIRHEATVLQQLQSFTELQPHVPRVLHAGEWPEGYVLFQAPVEGRRAPAKWTEMQDRFLQILRRAQRSEKLGAVVAGEADARWKKIAAAMNGAWLELGQRALDRARRLLDGRTVPCGIMHGDFAPWNMKIHDGRLLLIDWEAAEWEAPIWWDGFHFEVQVMSLLKKRSDWNSRFRSDPAERGCFLLYLLNSACRLFGEVPERRNEIDCREHLLVSELQGEA